MNPAQMVHDTKARPSSGRRRALGFLTGMAVLLAGCAGAPKPEAPRTDGHTACQAAAQGDTWVGNWLGVDKRKGVAGELRVQMILRQDGTMAYTEQLKRAGKSPQSLSESGCWHRQANELVMRTTHSNAVAVEQGDPIYTNSYTTRTSGPNLVLDGPEGPLSLKRMPDDYRLPLL
ncbi:MAG TPA: hypothetical protein VL003_12950 [Pusillimonas sp.]|uniref:hypothetical protein n=1 Tax=Pusillimonas sp. TaxID=3040095 RepID=UPI002BE1DB49|nr:hypothetical protein [Pusillimonas sp.]HUH88938.1 hypothetical protein [Pusillimonas sp.]